MPDSNDSRSDHEQQLDAIVSQYYEAVEQGDPPDQGAFIAQHPEFAAELREFFLDQRLLEGVAIHEATNSATYISNNAIGVEYKGRYRLDRILVEGAFGRVYLGYDEVIKRQVAIKVPSKARFQKPEDAEAYLTEARIVASLDHSHIVPVFDVGRTEDGSIYVVSQFLEGQTLAHRIEAGPLSEREAAQLLATVARALQHAHDRRLIESTLLSQRVDETDASMADCLDSIGHFVLNVACSKHRGRFCFRVPYFAFVPDARLNSFLLRFVFLPSIFNPTLPRLRLPSYTL